jgi:hypothetical protein
MKIRDSYATLNGDKTEHVLPSESLEIIADDGRKLYGIELKSDGSIVIDGGHTCRHARKVFDDSLEVVPLNANRILVRRAKAK